MIYMKNPHLAPGRRLGGKDLADSRLPLVVRRKPKKAFDLEEDLSGIEVRAES